jgi:1,4-alpha-glucan branching enzyme
MTKKSYTRTGKSCLVTFYLPADVQAGKAVLCGEFNGWDTAAKPMKRRKDGTYYASVHLDAGRSYRYRFFLDDERWENDWEAEQYLPNEHGSDDSVVNV